MGTAKDRKDKSNTGMWTVLGHYVVTPREEKKYLCRCDCGTERYVLERSLKHGGSQSCGCMTRQRALEKNEHKLQGKFFGEFEVIEKAEKKERNGKGGVVGIVSVIVAMRWIFLTTY